MDNESSEKKACQKCGRVYSIGTQFYKRKDGTRVDLCKNCLTLWMDPFKPDTFDYILKDLDVPYIPSEWNTTRDTSYARNPNLKPYTILGKYLSKMKMRQFLNYGYKDSPKLQEEYNKRKARRTEEVEAFDEEVKEKYLKGEISEAEYKTTVSPEFLYNNQSLSDNVPIESTPNPYGNPANFIEENILPDLSTELTKEDKIYLVMKWGRLYKPSELIELEKDYNNMVNSFDIQDADTRNSLILICKTNLKMNQYLDEGDLEGFQKLSKVSEGLRKSAKFTAAQNKEEKEEYVDSIGELISMCEKDGFIPRYPTNIPQDKVDATLKDMNDYIRKLVTKDLGFGKQIENALRKIQIQRDMEKDLNEEAELEDEDFMKFHQELEEQKVIDYESLNSEEDL